MDIPIHTPFPPLPGRHTSWLRRSNQTRDLEPGQSASQASSLVAIVRGSQATPEEAEHFQLTAMLQMISFDNGIVSYPQTPCERLNRWFRSFEYQTYR
jgi:hypothetical protein